MKRKDSPFAWLEQLAARHPGISSAERASIAIQDYIAAVDSLEFSFDCTSNPDGTSDEVLRIRAEYHQNLMLCALSVLDDAQVAETLAANMAQDHDGSSFPVKNIASVQSWRAGVDIPAYFELPAPADDTEHQRFSPA